MSPSMMASLPRVWLQSMAMASRRPVIVQCGNMMHFNRVFAALLCMGLVGIGWGVATPVPEAGWVVQGPITGLAVTNRPEVLLRAKRGAESVTVPLRIFLRDGQPHCIGEVPFESRFPGDQATPGRLSLGGAPLVLHWSLQVNGVDLPAAAAGGSVSFGPADRGRVDTIHPNFAIRAPEDTYETWSQRVFGRLVNGVGDEDADGRTNQAEFLAGSNPLDSGSVPEDWRPSIKLLTAGADGQLALEVTAGLGQELILEATMDLENWGVSQRARGLGEGNPMTFRLVPETGMSVGFWRVRVP